MIFAPINLTFSKCPKGAVGLNRSRGIGASL
jgi:hypothetical protein